MNNRDPATFEFIRNSNYYEQFLKGENIMNDSSMVPTSFIDHSKNLSHSNKNSLENYNMPSDLPKSMQSSEITNSEANMLRMKLFETNNRYV